MVWVELVVQRWFGQIVQNAPEVAFEDFDRCLIRVFDLLERVVLAPRGGGSVLVLGDLHLGWVGNPLALEFESVGVLAGGHHKLDPLHNHGVTLENQHCIDLIERVGKPALFVQTQV